MTASAAEVEAAQKAMGCWRHPSGRCWFHSNSPGRGVWTDRGCPVAVAVADVVVAAAQPRIAAEALREAASELSSLAHRWLDRANGKAQSNRQRDRFAVRGNKAAATLRCAKTLLTRADELAGSGT